MDSTTLLCTIMCLFRYCPCECTYVSRDKSVLLCIGAPTYIDLAIGSRVSCVKNLGTQMGKIQNSVTLAILTMHYTKNTLLNKLV